MKTCRTCKEEKILSDFHKDKGSSDGHRHECKACALSRSKEWNREHPDRAREHGRRWQASHLKERREYARRWRAANPDKALEQARRAYQKRAAAYRAQHIDP